jgi:hypothetical protein
MSSFGTHSLIHSPVVHMAVYFHRVAFARRTEEIHNTPESEPTSLKE